MDWERRFLELLHASRPAYDEAPDWRGALALYHGLSGAEARQLDQAILAMIDEDYRNPHSSRDNLPFDDVMVNLPAGMAPDDLLCIEAAVLVAAERGSGEALFALNRLMRAPRWHALSPRLYWLNSHGFTAQRKLLETAAGRCLGALLGLACGDALGGGPSGLALGEWSDDTGMALAVAGGIIAAPADPVEAVGRHLAGQLGDRAAGNGVLMRTLPAALAYGLDPAQAVRIARMTHPYPESDAAVTVYQVMVDSLLRGATTHDAYRCGLKAAGPLTDRLARIPDLTEEHVRATGYMVDTLEAAIWCLLTTDSLEACIVRAVNLGDDASTVGAVAGGLAGAAYGALAIPRRWSLALKHRSQLEEVAEKLFMLSRSDKQ